MTNRERGRALIAEYLGIASSQVIDEASFVEDLGADSLDKYELAIAIEEEFGVEIDDATIETFVTVGDVLDYIEKHAKELANG